MIANILGGDGLIVIVIALVVLVGGSQLPKIARNVGLAGKEFRKAQAEAEEEQAARKANAQGSGQPDPAPTPPPPVALPQAAAPAPPVSPAVGSGGSSGSSGSEGTITLTPAELDALLKAREQQARGETNN